MKRILGFFSKLKDRAADLETAGRCLRIAFTVLAIAAIAYTAVNTALAIKGLDIRKPPEKKFASRSGTTAPMAPEEYKNIVDRNLFGSSMKPSSSGITPSPSNYAGAPTSLQVELLGTIAGKNGYGYAIIEEKDKKKQGLYKVGDKVAGATLKEVRRNSVVLRISGSDELLEMRATPREALAPAAVPASPGSLPAPGGTPSPAQPRNLPAAGAAAEHPAAREVRDMLAEGNAKPHFNAGKMEGFFINRLREGSALKKAGLEDGDIVQSINDRKIENPNDVVWIQKLLSSPGEKLSLVVNRKGRLLNLNVN